MALKNFVHSLNVLVPAHNVEKAQLAHGLQIIDQFVNVRKDILEVHTLSVELNATGIVTVRQVDQHVSMEYVKIHAMDLAE